MGRGRVRDRAGDWVFLERDFLSSEMLSMSLSETLPKRLTGSLGAPSFEGLRALGLSAGRDGTRWRSVPLGVCLRRDRSCDFVTGLRLRCFFRFLAGPEGLCICAGGH